MDWSTLLSQKRLGKEKDNTLVTSSRSAFESDVDRIVFSSAFRRLGRKTQVHPLAANDHVHTRLTHSLEAAHVGRALGKELGRQIIKDLPGKNTPSDLGAIVYAACLAHDLGNPPFGHAGEEAMVHWFELNGPLYFSGFTQEDRRDLTSFEGNAQGFRILTQTENHLFDGGLRITYATLGTFQKYPWSSRKGVRKFGSFISEESILDRIAEEIGLISKGNHVWSRHPLAYLVESADDICYAIIDLEDAVELRILQPAQVYEFLLSHFEPQESKHLRATLGPPESHRINLARLRGPVFDFLINGAIEGYKRGYDRIMTGDYEDDIFSLLDMDDPRRKLIREAKELAHKSIFNDTKKIEIELGCYATFEILLESFCEAALNQASVLGNPEGREKLKRKSALVLQLLGDHAPSQNNAPPNTSWTSYQCLRRVIDYVSGMTDHYATYIAKQLQGTGFSGVQRP